MPLGPLVAVLLLCACATTNLSMTPLEPELSGTWTGTATLALTGRSPVPYTVPIAIAVTGSTASVTNICPGTVHHESVRQSSMRLPTESARTSSTSVNATGAGPSASWSGNLDCPKIELLGCAVMAISYTNVTMTLTGSNQLTVVVTGSAEGCGITYPLILSFVGAK
jgi:hypothetical protein